VVWSFINLRRGPTPGACQRFASLSAGGQGRLPAFSSICSPVSPSWVPFASLSAGGQGRLPAFSSIFVGGFTVADSRRFARSAPVVKGDGLFASLRSLGAGGQGRRLVRVASLARHR
jgi:hypothetical protein